MSKRKVAIKNKDIQESKNDEIQFYQVCKNCLLIFKNNTDFQYHKCEKSEESIFSKESLEEISSDFLRESFLKIKKEDKNLKKLNLKISELENKIKQDKVRFEMLKKVMENIFSEEEIPIDSKINVEIRFDKTPKTSPERKKKEHFISAEKISSVIEEKTEDEKKNIFTSLQKTNQEKGRKFFDEDKVTLLQKIKEEFDIFYEDRNSDHLEIIKEKRRKLLKFLGIDSYSKLVEDHYKRVLKEMKDKKLIYTQTKFRKYFSIFECRLICSEYSGGIESPLTNYLITETVEQEELERLHVGLEISKNISDFSEFNKENVLKNILNIDLAYNNLKQILKRELINTSGFNNIIYSEANQLKSKHSNKDDPFAFYILDKIENKRRNWRMDWKLQDFSTFLAGPIAIYCVSLFRKFYLSVFSDNIYRPDYMDRSPLLEGECEQLIQNMILVTYYFRFSELVVNLIKENANYVSTGNDKFNIYSDDKEASKHYKEHVSKYSYENDVKQILKELFDDFSSEDLEKFYIMKRGL